MNFQPLATIETYNSSAPSFWTLGGTPGGGDLALTPTVAVCPKVRATITECDGESTLQDKYPLDDRETTLNQCEILSTDQASILINPRKRRAEGDLGAILVWCERWRESTDDTLPPGWARIPLFPKYYEAVEPSLAAWQRAVARSERGMRFRPWWQFGYRLPSDDYALPVSRGEGIVELFFGSAPELAERIQREGADEVTRQLIHQFGIAKI